MRKFLTLVSAVISMLMITRFVAAEPVAIDTSSGVLYGTLELPRCQTQKPYPVALLIAGSGPTDRNGNTTIITGANNSLQYLAEGLAAQGIASLRYDKRGVGQSAKAMSREADARFETLIDDARSWMKFLRGDKRFSALIVIGHSEGSLIGMVAARQSWADAFVSVAGVGRPIPEVLLDQIRPQLPPELMQQSEEIVRALQQGKNVENVPTSLEALFRPSVQPYLISQFRYDPAQEIQKLRIPVLIVQGTTDIQVGVSEAARLAKANPKAKLQTIAGMNHVLKIVSDDRESQLRSYTDATLPVAPELIRVISEFAQRRR